MNKILTRAAVTAVVASAVTLATSCSSATYAEKLDYLHVTAQRGADAHKLLVEQEAKIDKKRCEDAYGGINNVSDAPLDDAGSRTPQWESQVMVFWVDSCVSGKPKPVPGSPQSPSSAEKPRPDGP